MENNVIKYSKGGQTFLDPPVAILEGYVLVFVL